MAAIGIREVALRAGVSVGTVSNVLNRPEAVAATTRERVLDAISALGYVRNDAARQLRAGRSRMIAMVVLDIANPFFTDVIRGAEEVADGAETSTSLMLLDSAGDAARERRQLAQIEEQRVLGVLITPVDDGRDSGLEQIARRGMPVVLVDRRSDRPDRCSVSVDDVLGGRLAGAHLLERGHRRLAFVGGPPGLRQVADRRAGFAAALAAAGGGGVELRIVETATRTVGAGREAAGLLAGLPVRARPTGVFCANDLVALGVLQELTSRGVGVPGEVAIVGYDDIYFAAAAAIPLSSVRQPRERLGRAAAELLLEEVNQPGSHEHRQVLFQPALVVRASSMIDRAVPAGSGATAVT
jgi:LacI family transcriptional regulator